MSIQYTHLKANLSLAVSFLKNIVGIRSLLSVNIEPPSIYIVAKMLFHFSFHVIFQLKFENLFYENKCLYVKSIVVYHLFFTRLKFTIPSTQFCLKDSL